MNMNSGNNELSVDRCKQIELEVLKYIKELCEKNHLKYYLMFGTLLGAVRHKGFIPWDDDIDILMPYEDYRKLLEIDKNSQDERYKLLCMEKNNDYNAPLAKMVDSKTILIQNYNLIEKVELGVYVDIFVLNGIGNTYEIARKNAKKNFSILKKWIYSICLFKKSLSPRNIASIIKRLPFRLIGYRHYLSEVERFRQGKETDNNIYVTQTSLTSPNSVDRNIWKKEDFGEGVDICFEGEIFKAPNNYKQILTVLYGDYMVLPPREKQITHHDFKAYMK